MKAMMLAGTAIAALGANAVLAQAAAPATDLAAAAQSTVAVPNNILLQDWTGPYGGVPPWDQVKPEQFDEAIQFAIDELKREAAAIAGNPAPPTFANTIETSEKAGERVSNVLSVFSVMTDNMS